MDQKKQPQADQMATGDNATESMSPSAAVAAEGVGTVRQFVRLMEAIMQDTLTGRIGPEVAKATVNAGGKLLKAVELQHKYGRPTRTGKSLALIEPEAEQLPAREAGRITENGEHT